MILIVDFYYGDDNAHAAGIVIESWEGSVVAERLTAAVDGFPGYIPGKFYLRELPCIIELQKKRFCDKRNNKQYKSRGVFSDFFDWAIFSNMFGVSRKPRKKNAFACHPNGVISIASEIWQESRFF